MKKLEKVNNYYLTGPDGSGKTTILREVEKKILEEGRQVKYIWIRSPKILSKPLMGFCRLIGLTNYETIDGIKYGSHEFQKSKVVSYLFPLLQLIDFKIKWLYLKKKIDVNDVVLFDRFSLDTLADLMIDTKRLKLHQSWIGRKFIETSKDCNVLILYVDESIIKKRKKDTLHDKNVMLKNQVYKILAEDLGIKMVNNNGEIRDTLLEVFKEFDI